MLWGIAFFNYADRQAIFSVFPLLQREMGLSPVELGLLGGVRRGGPAQRGTAAGFMNTVGWLAGGGSAPVVIGLVATRHGLGVAIALASIVYLGAAALLAAEILFMRRQEWTERERASRAQN